jgi:hypothetical protein
VTEFQAPTASRSGIGFYSNLAKALVWNRGPDFPFTVGPIDPELFVIEPRTSRHEIEWVLELDWTHQRLTGTMTIDNQGEPFRLYPYRKKLNQVLVQKMVPTMRLLQRRCLRMPARLAVCDTPRKATHIGHRLQPGVRTGTHRVPKGLRKAPPAG